MTNKPLTLKEIKKCLNTGGSIKHINGKSVAHVEYVGSSNNILRVRFEYETNLNMMDIDEFILIQNESNK